MNQWLIGAGAAIILALGIQTWRIEGYQDRAATYKATIQAHEQAAAANNAAISACVAVNEANEREAERLRQEAEQAAIRAKMQRAELENRIASLTDQAQEFNDEQCRTLDEPLPNDFVSWLRDT